MSAYLLVNIEVHDPGTFADYVAQVPAMIEKHGGRYLVRGGESTVHEGNWQPKRIVVLEFPDRNTAQSFLDDPEYAPIAAIRHRSATTDLVIVDGYGG